MYFELLQEFQGCVMKWFGSTDRKSSGCTNLTCVEGAREVVLGIVLWRCGLRFRNGFVACPVGSSC